MRQVAARGALTVASEVVAALAAAILWAVIIAAVAGAVWFISGKLGARSADKPIRSGPRMAQPASQPGFPTPKPTSVPARPAYEVWERTGPFFSSNDQEGRLPARLAVAQESMTFSQDADGKKYQNTLMWTPPPEAVHPGDEVMLTISATTEQRGASVGGWWNINCQADGSGDTSAGSSNNYRLTGSPDPHVATYRFKFAPGSDPYVQLSAGHDPAPDTWVLVTYKYVRKSP